jgi:hypothetical protein
MTVFVRYAAIAALFALLGGCASLPPRVALDRAASPSIKTIAILEPAIPKRPLAPMGGSVMAVPLFGAVGGLAYASAQISRGEQYGEALEQKQFSLRNLFVQRLTTALQAKGYAVSLLPVGRRGNGVASRYPSASESGVDAYLDLSVSAYGYFGSPTVGSVRPLMAMRCKLVKAIDSTTLMRDTITYGAIRESTNLTLIVPPGAYAFESFADIMANLDKSIQGLDEGVTLSVNNIASLL